MTPTTSNAEALASVPAPTPSLHIAFYINSVPFTVDVVSGKASLGGSESACLALARGLSLRGHDVHIFVEEVEEEATRTPDWAGVTFHPASHLWDTLRFAAPDVFVSLRMPAVFNRRIPAKLNILWSQDLLTPGFDKQVDSTLFQVDQVHYVSRYHRAQWEGVSKLVGRIPSYITDNPFDVWKAGKTAVSATRGRYTLAHISRPERGLDAVLRYWPKIRAKYPQAKLILSRYSSMYDAKGWGRVVAEYDQKVELVNQAVGGIEFAGELGKEDLYRLLGSVNALFYPTSQPGFAETNCIAVAEAQACGCPVIASRLGAIPETLKPGAGVLVDGDYLDPQTEAGFLAAVDLIFEGKDGSGLGWSKEAQAMGRAGQLAASQFDLKRVAERWEAHVLQTFRDRASANQLGILRQLLHDDNHVHALKLAEVIIEAADSLGGGDDYYPEEAHEAAALCRRVIAQEDLTADQYAQFAVQDPLGEMQVNGRLIKAAQSISDSLPDLRAMEGGEGRYWNVLDVAGGNGTFALLLLKSRPDVRVTLIDFSEGVLKMAMQGAEKLGVADRLVTHAISPWDYKVQHPDAQFDALMCGEFLEHVEKPHELIDLLESMVVPGGHFILTTPCGPFYELLDPSIPRHRGHLHSFTMRDMTTMLAGRQAHCDYLDMGFTPWGSPVGTWFVTVASREVKDRAPAPPIDYSHLLLTERPYQRIIAGMIVKDGVGTLHRAIESVYRVVDELVIFDTGSTDGTQEVYARWLALPDSKLSVYDGRWPGDFSVARNEVLKLVEEDHGAEWFMWFDADEVLENAAAVRMVANAQSPFVGYTIRQHHVMVDQPTFFDKPCRLFRTGQGIQFYGVVHEQPGPGTGTDPYGPQDTSLFPVMDLGSPQSPLFWHVGYQNEATRRAKMFQRNRPLLLKELNGHGTHPARELAWAFEIRDQLNLAKYAEDRVTQRKHLLTALGIYERRDMGNPDNPASGPATEWYEQALDEANLGYTVLYGMTIGQTRKVNPPKAARAKVRQYEDGRARMHAWVDATFDAHEAKPADTRPYEDMEGAKGMTPGAKGMVPVPDPVVD